MRGILFLLTFLGISFFSFAQHIFSEKEFEYKRAFLPYDVPYTFALEDKQFVMLQESKKNTMKLGRYDQYFFEQWEVILELNEEESAPQVFVNQGKVFVYSMTTFPKSQQFKVTFRSFDIESGKELPPVSYVLDIAETGGYLPRLSFSEDKSRFVIFDFLAQQDGEAMVEFRIYNLGDEKPWKKYYLDVTNGGSSLAKNVHLSNNGDLFLAVVNASEFKVNTYFWSRNKNDAEQISNNFFFERPIDGIDKVDIIRQGSSTYFVTLSALIEKELIGFSIGSYNVILNSVLYSHHQNFSDEQINSLYQDFYLTSQNQKKKNLQIPELLKDYRLTASFVNAQNDIVLTFEQLEKPLEYHENVSSNNMPWKHRSDEDKFYFGGDVLLYCYSQTGEEKWKKTIQRTQYSQANGLALSFIPEIKNNRLRFVTHENSKGGNFYLMDINTTDGSLQNKINLIPEGKFEFTKKYSCLLDEHAVIICGISPFNAAKRKLMLVEF